MSHPGGGRGDRLEQADHTWGSRVNYGSNDNQNSPLHLAAIKGNIEMCSLLLKFGAKRYVTNHINRTAAQMAAENGHFHCAAMINNFVPQEEVRYYTLPEFTGAEPKLPPELEGIFYRFIMMTNIHPVKVVFELPPVFLVNDNALKIVNVLQLMSKRQFYKKEECPSTVEMLSFKFHYLATILFELAKPNDDTSKKQTDPKDVFIQKISTVENYLQQFLYECIVKFCPKDTTLFRKMVSYMVQGMDSLPPLDIILLLVGNKRAQSVESTAEPSPTCAACDEINPSKKCPKCKAVQYCNRECLKIHSVMHKKKCKQIRKEIKDLKSSEETSALAKCLSKIGIK
ncbi:ankyrin repeat and MYND domain-containing protein 2-like [Acyrthosiphon pisum]|uniref:MYND-type domain-containing protein n=1 Tax=Acyrthosiphon pisum TaxID=7029 RepID=A0A8R1W0V7_ACYPI|nr:ankyrin repeat and MYND domain-containing protein 2-like [Acyrthosiphon pisum]|eukprot:XP_001946419.2 PREDICTED: ankyrin repeat and MYND domain-containing protein 2-like isoform X2 [Acyrthosiphon pisum]